MDSKTESDEKRVSHPIYNLLPTEIVGFDSLAELARGRQNANDSSETFNYGLSGHPWQRSGEWRQPLAWESQPAPVCATVSTLARGRSARLVRDQRSPHADMGWQR